MKKMGDFTNLTSLNYLGQYPPKSDLLHHPAAAVHSRKMQKL